MHVGPFSSSGLIGCQAAACALLRDHWVFFSLWAMISGAVKFTPQGVN